MNCEAVPRRRDRSFDRGSTGISFRVTLCAWLCLLPAPAAAQRDGPVWNDARAVQLMEMARVRRQQPLADSLLANYEARAEGLVYFYLERRDTDERVLVKTDQVALEVFWAQPDLTKQRIVGLRDESALPNRMRYHLDHLTVVQNGFGDVMRMGDGDEVADVPHPAAPGADSIYDFRLVDSLTLRLPGKPTPVKAYRIDVRPRRMDRSAIIGSVFVDHETGDVVRMTFTFTPASYVDRRLERINISLDNSLWEGRYWLPWEQAVEIRRQLPELDFVATSVIQGRFRVQDYVFNQDLPPSLFWGYRVTTVPRAQREAFPFSREIYDELHELGLAPPPQMEELRAQAAALVRQRVLSGLPRLRLSLPDASQVLRYDRAHGLQPGAGASFALNTATRLESTFGWSFGLAQPALGVAVRHEFGLRTTLRVRAYANETRDLGVRPGAPGALNTVAAFGGADYLDVYRADGARLSLHHTLSPDWQLDLGASWEQHEASGLTRTRGPLGGTFRPVLPVDEGTWAGGTVAIERPLRETAGWSWGGRLALHGGALEGDASVGQRLDLRVRRVSMDRDRDLLLRFTAGALEGSPPLQSHALLGGRETLPGYAYRSIASDRFVLVDAEATAVLWRPFVRGRLLGAAGWAGEQQEEMRTPGEAARLHAAWGTTSAGAGLASAGAGVGLFWDVLRFDLVRGLGRGGEWQLLFSVNPSLWPIL